MEYKFNEEVKKAMRRQGGEDNDVVQSIAKDAYKKGFEEWGEQRRARSIEKRSQKAEALKEEVLKLRKECPEITQKDIALMLGVSTRTVIRKLGQGKTEEIASI